MHGTAMPPSTPDVLRRLIDDVLAGGDMVLMADSAEACSLLDQAAADLGQRRSRVYRLHAGGPDGLGLGGLLAQLRQQPGQQGDTDQVLERDFATLTTLDPSCDRIVLLVDDAHRLQPGALRYLDLVCQASADLRLVFAGAPRLLEIIEEPQFPGLAARFQRVPLAAAPAFIEAPARARPAEAKPAPVLAAPPPVAAAPPPSAPRRSAPVAEFDAEDDGIAPWEFAAAAARPAPMPAAAASAAPAMHREPPRRPAAAAAFVRPAAIRPLAPRRVQTSNPMRFDLQTAAALGAMAAGIAIYFAWTGQSAKPPMFIPPAPIVQPDSPSASVVPPALPQPPADPQQDAQTAPVPNPPALVQQAPVQQAPPQQAPAQQAPVAMVPPAAVPVSPAPAPGAPRPDTQAAVPNSPLPIPGAAEPGTGATDPAARLPLPPKPARVPRERRDPATRYAAPAPAPGRSSHAAYPPDSQAWYNQYDTPSYTTPPPSSLPTPPPSQPQVQRPWRDQQAGSDPSDTWNKTDSPTPPYIGTYTAGPNGVRSFRYGQ